MNPIKTTNDSSMMGGYMPYFYASGLHQLYFQPRDSMVVGKYLSSSNDYDFTSDILVNTGWPRVQTVEDIIKRGYFSIPESEPETAIISDKKHTSRLGLDDVINQVKNRQQIYQRNIYDLEIAKCAAINSLYDHEAKHGPADAKVEYSLNKRLDELYSEQRDERVNFWRDVSRVKLLLPEQAQSYLSSYRKVAILEDLEGDGI